VFYSIGKYEMFRTIQFEYNLMLSLSVSIIVSNHEGTTEVCMDAVGCQLQANISQTF